MHRSSQQYSPRFAVGVAPILRLLSAAAFWLIAGAQSQAAPPAHSQDAVWNERGCAEDARGKWFRDAKFGAFIHFGLYSELGGYWHGKGPYDPSEQIIGLGQKHAMISAGQYRDEVGGAFNPTNFNAAQWVRLIKAAGQKYLIVTAKHHDGFCMFRTSTTSYNVVQATPFARDVLRELADECRKQGIVFCPYYSIGDWCAAQVRAPRFSNYHDYMFAQLKELLTQYGPIRLLWFDNWWYVNNQWHNDLPHAKELYDYVRSLSPTTLVNDRCGRGAASEDGDYATPENQLKGSLQSRYFEVVMTDTDDDNWGWVKTATNYRKPADLVRNLIDCVSKGGNFVLNVGPTATGEFPPQHQALLQAIGAWTSVNGEAIYGTVPAPECSFDRVDGLQAYATRKGRFFYVEIVRWPLGRELVRVRIKRKGLESATLLDDRLAPLKWASARSGEETTFELQKPQKADPYATVVKLTFQAAAQ